VQQLDQTEEMDPQTRLALEALYLAVCEYLAKQEEADGDGSPALRP
jgi:hypothetical protein